MPNLANKKDCTGCTACINVCAHKAIVMYADSEGFLYPTINESQCVQCGLCEQVCPVLTITESGNTDQPIVYAMWHKHDRVKSSSGGAFSALARLIFSKGGKVYGAAFDENLVLQHVGISSIEELQKLRGSKYLQSNLGDIFKDVKKDLLEERWVLFCGTPCQIAGLKAYLRKSYKNLLTADLVCHGVPSQKIFDSYLMKLCKEIRIETIQNYGFRKLDGWAISPSIKVNGKDISLYGINSLYMEAFNKNALFRESCYNCKFAKLPRIGDCTIADFWGLGRHSTPFNYDIMKGISLILVNNEKGENAINEIQNSVIVKRDLQEALIENHNITCASERHPNRNEIISSFLDEEKSLSDINKKYHLVKLNFKIIVKIYASKWGVFNIAKRIYNKYKSFKSL